METLVREETLAPWFTEDPFCACEDVKTLESALHHERLAQLEQDLRLHLREQDLSCVLTSDLLIRNVPLRAGLAPDIAIWPAGQAPEAGVDYKSLELSAELCPALVLEVVSESTAEADRDTKYQIYQLAEIAEYWLYDPLGYAGRMPLQGWRLAGGVYTPIAGRPETVAGAEVVLYPSAVLETAWGLEHDIELRLWNPVRADWYRMTPETLQQERALVQQERALVRQERDRAEQAEALVRQERDRAEQAEALVQQERARARQREARLEQEIQRLRVQSEARAGTD